jgi:4-hydroxy-3-methylbut-2-enyl diphosphate reductase
MIHNPQVNEDLLQRGIQFLQDTHGNELISFDTITGEDIVIIPAFGTTIAIEQRLKDKGIATHRFNTTCPFVEKVWNRSEQIAEKKFTVVVHGKPTHEETRATFSHAAINGPAIVINDMKEAILLGEYINREKETGEFYETFAGRYSPGFDPAKDLEQIGVVNQTTMLAADTQAIADYLKAIVQQKFGGDAANTSAHFADTRDTLCYATNDNQSAVYELLNTEADFAVVVGGYNSSNTSHLVELCENKLPTYFVNGADNILSADTIVHYDFHNKAEKITHGFLPADQPVKVLITSGASCPDALVESVISKLVSFFPAAGNMDEIKSAFTG